MFKKFFDEHSLATVTEAGNNYPPSFPPNDAGMYEKMSASGLCDVVIHVRLECLQQLLLVFRPS